MELKDLRDQIDLIDNELITLFNKRMQIAAQVAEYKKAHHLPIYVPSRELKILKEVERKSDPDLADYACLLYSMIFELSRSYQSNCDSVLIQQFKSIIDSKGNADPNQD